MTEDLTDYWRRRAEQAEQRAHDIANATAPLQLELTMAQADVAALKRACYRMAGVIRGVTDTTCPLCGARIASLGDHHTDDCPMNMLDHPGAGLPAELEAARAVVTAARTGFGTEADIERAYAFDPNALTAAIRAYDAAVKARKG